MYIINYDNFRNNVFFFTLKATKCVWQLGFARTHRGLTALIQSPDSLDGFEEGLRERGQGNGRGKRVQVWSRGTV